jgi:hypothetical protein
MDETERVLEAGVDCKLAGVEKSDGCKQAFDYLDRHIDSHVSEGPHQVYT